jgi:hypothetical protein
MVQLKTAATNAVLHGQWYSITAHVQLLSNVVKPCGWCKPYFLAHPPQDSFLLFWAEAAERSSYGANSF